LGYLVVKINSMPPQGFESASDMASKREKAIQSAISHYFNGGPWGESDISDLARIDVDQFGNTDFSINGIPKVRFGQIKTSTEITGGQVKIWFSQIIEVLYK